MNRRYLLAVNSVPGHLHPNIALAHALNERGHDIAFYCGRIARPTVEHEGFRCFDYAADLDEQMMRIYLPDEGASLASGLGVRPVSLAAIRRINRTLCEWFLDPVPQQVRDLTDVIERFKPDVLVTDITLFGPTLVLAETQPVPVAVFCALMSCPLPGPDAPTWGRGLPPPRTWTSRLRSRVERIISDRVLASFRARADELRRHYGLQPAGCSVMELSGRLPLFLMCTAPELDYERRDLPSCVEYVGPCLWHRPRDEQAPRWISEIARDRPVVHVTEGTVHTDRPILLDAAARGLGEMVATVIMTTGKLRDPAALGLAAPPANMRIERYVSHGDLFPHTDLVVTTGGSGTILTALGCGVPLIIVPVGWDHRENGRRVVEAGAGEILESGECTPQRLRAAVEGVLREPSYKKNAKRIAAALSRPGGPSRAADLLEHLQAPSARYPSSVALPTAARALVTTQHSSAIEHGSENWDDSSETTHG